MKMRIYVNIAECLNGNKIKIMKILDSEITTKDSIGETLYFVRRKVKRFLRKPRWEYVNEVGWPSQYAFNTYDIEEAMAVLDSGKMLINNYVPIHNKEEYKHHFKKHIKGEN